MARIDMDGLLKKGFSTSKAEIVLAKKLSWNTLQLMKDDELRDLLGEDADYYIGIVRTSGRAEIPSETYDNLMYDSNRTCCICKNDSRPIIIHHIEPWKDSSSHAYENLVVLCVLHHSHAHVGLLKGGILDKKLTPSEIRMHKEKWIEEVKEIKRRSVLGMIKENDHYNWIYYNPRFMTLIMESGIDVKKARYYRELLSANVIDQYGSPTPTFMNDQTKSYWTDGGYIIYLDRYFSELSSMAMSKLDFINLNKEWKNVDEVYNVIHNNRLVVFQGKFYFKDDANRTNKTHNGTGQYRIGHLGSRSKKLSLEFVHDLYHCTSNSAKNVHLAGQNEITIFANARNASVEDGKLIIKPTVYAIGLWFNGIGSKFSVIE